jgi:alpha-glucosidase
LHLFVKEQPDLNWRNPEVKKSVLDSIKFWLDRGVDGFRFDVVNLFYKDSRYRSNPLKYPNERIEFNRFYHLYTRDRPETLLAAEEIRELMDTYSDRVSIGEVATELGPSGYFEYTRPGRLNLAFNFDFKELKPFNAKVFYEHIKTNETVFRDFAWPSYVLGNHDSKRYLSKLGGGIEAEKKARVMAGLLLTLRGTPFIYYGEEIGMSETNIPYDKIVDPQGRNLWPENVGRDGCRTPMQWDENPYGSFSSVEPWLPLNGNYTTVNADNEKKDPDSMYHYYKRLIDARKQSDALKYGRLEFVETPKEDILMYYRVFEEDEILVILNFGNRFTDIDLALYGIEEIVFLGGSEQLTGKLKSRVFIIRPYDVIILKVKR